MSLGAPVTFSLIEFYFITISIMIVVTISGIFMAINYFLNYTLCFLYLSYSGSASSQLPGCFHPWTFSVNIGLNMFPLDSFMSCLHSLLRYSTGSSMLCNWLSLRWLVPWINNLPPVCWSTFRKSSRFVSLTWRKTFLLFLIVSHLHVLQYNTLLSFTLSSCL